MISSSWIASALVSLSTILSFSTAFPHNPRAAPITATFTPYQLYQCNLGTIPFQAPTTLVDGTCNTFSPATTTPPYIEGYQGFMAMLNEATKKSCTLVFYESPQCGTLGQTTNAVPVPANGKECKPITLDPLGTIISNGARSVLMTCT